MKNFIKYSLIAIAIAAIIVFAVHFIKSDYKIATNEDIETEMLQIQAKAKIEFEKYHVDKENGLKGEEIENSEYGIDEEGKFYKWTKETLDEVGLTQNSLEDGEYYLVNYDTEEVIYFSKDETYKLSEFEQKEIVEEPKETEKVEEGEKQTDEGERDSETEQVEGN